MSERRWKRRRSWRSRGRPTSRRRTRDVSDGASSPGAGAGAGGGSPGGGWTGASRGGGSGPGVGSGTPQHTHASAFFRPSRRRGSEFTRPGLARAPGTGIVVARWACVTGGRTPLWRFDGMDVVLLSRIQFALTVGFHFLFPPLTIGLAWLLVVIEWRGWKRDDRCGMRMGRFFGKLLALTFAVGVATGIVMEFQFGTNWAAYSRFVGDIFGAPLAAEGVLRLLPGVRLPRAVPVRARPRVEGGALVLDPDGGRRIAPSRPSGSWWRTRGSRRPPATWSSNGRAELTSFSEAVFNPSTLPAVLPYGGLRRWSPALLGGRRGGLSAAQEPRGRSSAGARRSELAVVVGLVASVPMLVPVRAHPRAAGGAHPAGEVRRHRGAVIEPVGGAAGAVRADPVTPPPELKAKVEIRGLLSWLAFGDVNAPIRGIAEFPRRRTGRRCG